MATQPDKQPDEPSESLNAIGNTVCDGLVNLRVQSISLHDADGDILWLSEGVMGPDENSLVIEATQALALATDRTYVFQNMGDGRAAAFYPARTPMGELVGLATVICESKWLDNAGAGRLVTPQLTAAMRRLAIFRKPTAVTAPPVAPAAAVPAKKAKEKAIAATKAATANTSRDDTLTTGLRLVVADQLAGMRDKADRSDKTAGRPKPVVTAHHTDKPTVATLPGGQGTFHFQGTEFQLHVQQLLKLRSGGGTRRYEVLARPAGRSHTPESISDTVRVAIGTSELDRLVISELLAWIESHPTVLDNSPSSFSCNLSMSSIADPKFLAFVASQLKSRDVPAGTVGFELSEQACVEQQRDVEMFIAACEKLGCYVVIDDFTLDSRVLPWLASPAMRFVKIDSKITTSAMTSRLQQAMVIAMSQMSKVLGISCVAKRIDTPAARQWLSAVGVDYAQGFVLEEPKPLSELG